MNKISGGSSGTSVGWDSRSREFVKVFVYKTKLAKSEKRS